MILALLLSCLPSPEGSLSRTPVPVEVEADTGPHTDTAAGRVDVPRPSPDLDAQGVAAALSAAFAAGIPEPLLPRRAYLASFDGRDPNCPGGDGYSLQGRFQGCVAESGWTYAGRAEYTGPTDIDVVGDFHLLGDFQVQDPAGHWFIGGGELDLSITQEGPRTAWAARIAGTWSYPGGEAWMVPEGTGAMLDLDVVSENGRWTIALEGTVTDTEHAIRLRDVRATDGECGGAPTGEFGLRGEGGYWYWFAADCGCGPVRFDDGSELGEACLDLGSSLSDLAAAVPG